MNFWKFWSEEIYGLDCPEEGACCTKIVHAHYTDPDTGVTTPWTYEMKYCPGHWGIECTLKLNFDMDMVFDRLSFNDEDMDLYDDELTEINKNS